MEGLLANAEFTNPILRRFLNSEQKFCSKIDKESTIEFLHVDINMMKFIHEGMIFSKESYQSPLVA